MHPRTERAFSGIGTSWGPCGRGSWGGASGLPQPDQRVDAPSQQSRVAAGAFGAW